MDILDLIQSVPLLLSFLDAKDCTRLVCTKKMDCKDFISCVAYYNKFCLCSSASEISLKQIYLGFKYDKKFVQKIIQNGWTFLLLVDKTMYHEKTPKQWFLRQPKAFRNYMLTAEKKFTPNIIYWEIEIQSFLSQSDCVSVGFSSMHQYKYNIYQQHLVGWTGDQFGWHSDDGWLFRNNEHIYYLGCFGKSDVIGCGLLLETGQYFYTCNGVLLYITNPYSLKVKMYPTMIADIELNYDINMGNKPFKYKVENFSTAIVK